MKKLMILLCLLVSVTVFAGPEAGKLITYEGKVKIYQVDNVRGQNIVQNYVGLFVQDLIRTKRNSTASIKLADESNIVLTEKSSLEILDLKDINVSEGKVLFKIKTQGDTRGIKIATKTATIGVKGTTFAVVADNSSVGIFLQEGNLKVEPIQGDFKHFIKKEMDFDSYLKEQNEDFKEYKDTMEKEFIEFVKEIAMEGGTAITISTENEVRDVKIPSDLEAEFYLLEQF